jgi:dephospho-CoA kinase
MVSLRVFGLTGGIGSGKSTVALRWRARRLAVVNADDLSREAVAYGSPALRQIIDHFGSDVLTASGQLDRAQMGQRVFSNPDARRALDGIVHPIVRQLAAQRFLELSRQGEPLACYEVPLLYEFGLERTYHPVVVVTAPLALRKSRLAIRDGLSQGQIIARISAQMPLEEKVQRADYVIDNAGSLPALQVQADAVLEALCEALGVAGTRYPPLPASADQGA